MRSARSSSAFNAAIAIFQASGDGETLAAYVDLHRLFKYGELTALCKAALGNGPKNTREIATYVAKAKGLDAGDKVLAKTLCFKLIHALRRMRRDGRIVGAGRYKAAHLAA